MTATVPAPAPAEPKLAWWDIRRVVGPYSAGPLLILFALNAVDELDRTAFGVLIPEIRDAFGLDNQGILTVITIVVTLSLGLQPFIGFLGDRQSRVRIALAGAIGWGVFSFLTGLAPTIVFLIVFRMGSGIGRLVNDPTHNSLLSDYYPPERRPAIYSFHRAGNSLGQILGPSVAGGLAVLFGWRVPFLVLAVPTIILVIVAATRLKEPVRGRFERMASGTSDELLDLEDRPPSLAEGWRICFEIKTIKRIWSSYPFFTVSLVGLGALTSIYYEDVFGLNEFERGIIQSISEPFQLLGILVFAPLSMRLVREDPGKILRLVAVVGSIAAACFVGLAAAPNVATAVAANIAASSVIGAIVPGLLSVQSLVLPPRARALGFSLSAVFILPGVFVLIIIGGVADSSGIRTALLILVPIFLLGSFILASASPFVAADMQKVQASAKAQAEVRKAQIDGTSKLLLVKDLDVAYGSVQVLFGVDFEVTEGEIIALLGTNGAGKSTLLKAISGLQPAKAGAVIFEGNDITFATPQEIAAQGVIQVPGGKGVFPGLSVEENLKIAGWLYQRDEAYVNGAIDEVTAMFPVLKERWNQPAGNLSGGEQQMVTLAQAFIMKPKLLMIDELSLGLAPIIVEQLLGIVQAIRDQGTTLILVEQSVNVALTVAETAYFMEKGEIRFKGPTKELLERPDVLRSVFLEGAAASGGPGTNGSNESSASGAAPATEAIDLDVTIDVRTTGARLARNLDAPILETRSLVKAFGGIRATDDVSFELGHGEIVGFIGPNGAGKTTLFDQISGFLTPDSGRIFLHGIDVTSAGPDARARLGLGRSFQDAKLFPALTVSDTIKLALERQLDVRDPLAAALNLPIVAESERRLTLQVDDLIEMMGIQAFADKFISELSTGSRRIVDMACIVAHEPDVILFDEPSSGIAQSETEALGPLLLRIREATNASLLVIEHDMPLITSVSDRLIALDLGHVVTAGPPTEVINHPEVVAAYLGTNEAAISRSGRSS